MTAELRAGGFSTYTLTPVDERSHDYAFKKNHIGTMLKREGDNYVEFRCAPLVAPRANTAVTETTAQADLQNFYRFVGFLGLKALTEDGAVVSLALLMLKHSIST